VELASISKEVQQDIKELQDSVSENEIHSVIIKGKSQFRYFFSDTSLSEELSAGLLGGQKLYQEGPAWEFGRLRGIKASCATSRYILGDEYVLHGDHTGKVYRQESGTSFNGANIEAEYSTPYLDFGSPALRKTIHSIRIFVRPEGDLTLNVAVMYDWGDQDAINPSPYSATTTGTDAAVYGVALYGTDEYGGITVPAILTNIQGSGDSARFTFSTTGTEPSYSIQSLLPIFKTEGYR
jgi:hypothetical protein